MVRKRRTDLSSRGESSESQDSGAGQGAPQRPPQQPQQQQGRGAPQVYPQQQQGPGGRGSAPQQQVPGGRGFVPQQQGPGGRGFSPQQQGGGNQGRGGYGGGPRGGMAPQQYSGDSPYQQQGRGTQQPQPRGPLPQHRGGGVAGGGRGGFVPSAGTRPSVPELHQASQAQPQAGVMTHPIPHMVPAEVAQSEGSSSVGADEPSSSDLTEQLQHVSLKSESSSIEAAQPNPVSSKALRFPLRPGRGSTGSRIVVKANHFFAELPDKDLHQYDVSLIECALVSLYSFYISQPAIVLHIT